MPVRSVISIDATRAKHRFGEVLRHAGRKEVVALSKRGREVAYVISPEMYARLEHMQPARKTPLEALEAEFARLVDGMQEQAARDSVDRLLEADDLTINAVARKVRRGRKK